MVLPPWFWVMSIITHPDHEVNPLLKFSEIAKEQEG